jgi:hypothetical protein
LWRLWSGREECKEARSEAEIRQKQEKVMVFGSISGEVCGNRAAYATYQIDYPELAAERRNRGAKGGREKAGGERGWLESGRRRASEAKEGMAKGKGWKGMRKKGEERRNGDAIDWGCELKVSVTARQKKGPVRAPFTSSSRLLSNLVPWFVYATRWMFRCAACLPALICGFERRASSLLLLVVLQASACGERVLRNRGFSRTARQPKHTITTLLHPSASGFSPILSLCRRCTPFLPSSSAVHGFPLVPWWPLVHE